MSTLPLPNNLSSPTPVLARGQGRWKWGAGILLLACVSQGILWTLWMEDPTHFKMSILFVWPAALFALTIWWLFFSGWSWLVRLGVYAAMVAPLILLLSFYRLEFDGDMVPRRISLRSAPSAEEVARQFLKQAPTATPVLTADDVQTPPKLTLTEGDWPGFRGARRDGVVVKGSLRRNWESSPPTEIWRHPIGRGWSAFSVVGKYAFTQEQRDEVECVVAYDAETGTQIWVHEDKALLAIVDANGGPGPHATPEFDDGLLYSLGGTGILNCLDAVSGKPVWSTNILKDAGDGTIPAKPPEWGVSNSPLIVDNFVIVIAGGTSNKCVAAYDKKSGNKVWANGKNPASYGSARAETIEGVRQILAPTGKGISAHAFDTGEPLWSFDLFNDPQVNSAVPWKLDDGSVLFGTGYGVGTVLLDPKLSDGKWTVTKRWATNRFRPKFNDFVVLNGDVYGLDDGTLTCVNIVDGKIRWKAGRYGYGQLLLVDDVLLIISEDGDLLLVPAVPKKSEPLATFKLFHSGFCWNHLALVRGRLFARNANEAVCLDVGEPSQSPSSL